MLSSWGIGVRRGSFKYSNLIARVGLAYRSGKGTLEVSIMLI
jgi:hypothetical protein